MKNVDEVYVDSTDTQDTDVTTESLNVSMEETPGKVGKTKKVLVKKLKKLKVVWRKYV